MGETLLKSSSKSPDPWQVNQRTLQQKWAYVWKNELYTDVIFKVGETQEVISCHRIILIINSPVFETMLSNRWSKGSTCTSATEEKQPHTEILLPEESPELFKIFLEFMYTGAVNLEPKEADPIISVLLLGKKYLCPALVDKCTDLLKESLSLDNVMQIYQAADMLDNEELQKTVERYMLDNAGPLIESGEFKNLTKKDLMKLLSSDELNVAEIELFNAVYEWAEMECERQNMDKSKQVAEVLNDILPLIRFPSMSTEEFSCFVVTKNVLPLEDTVNVFRFLTTPPEKREQFESSLNLKFNPRKRNLSYFLYNLQRLKGHGYDFGRQFQNICFQADRSIRLVSVGFFRAIEQDATLDVTVKIQNFELTEIFAEIVESGAKCPRGQDVFHVHFKQPVKILKDRFYTISYMLKGKETFYKTVGQSVIVANCGSEGKVTFTFREALRDTDMDQLPELCFRF